MLRVLVIISIIIGSIFGLKPMGKIHCSIDYRMSDEALQASDSCEEKITKDKKNGEERPFLRNSTLENFDYDDHCLLGCVYEELELMSKDGVLVTKNDTPKIFQKGKISDDKYLKISSIWDSCLEDSAKVVKAKGQDKCKAALLHEFCFFKRLRDASNSFEIEC